MTVQDVIDELDKHPKNARVALGMFNNEITLAVEEDGKLYSVVSAPNTEAPPPLQAGFKWMRKQTIH